MSLSKDQFLIVEIGNGTAIVRMPVAMSATVVVLGDSSPGVDVKTSVSEVLDANGVCWN